MRSILLKKLHQMAQEKDDLYLLTANLGFKLFDDFKNSYPQKFIDVGVAEPNMIGIAAGMALSGKNVYCYSMIPFLIMRSYEQIRVDVAYHQLNVKLIGVGSGFTYGLEGFTHFGIEDMALMRAMPNMTVVAPAGAEDVEELVRISFDYPGPLYIRLGRVNPLFKYPNKFSFKIGKGVVVQEGQDIVIFAIGDMVWEAWQTVELLKNKGISATLINMHTLKPLDTSLIKEYTKSSAHVFTIEEHSVIGGLGSAVAEVLAESGYQGQFQRIGIPEKLLDISGTSPYLREQYGLVADQIYMKILNAFIKERVC